MLIILLAVSLIVALIFLARWWIQAYNDFQKRYTQAERQFADVDVVIQQRLDNIYALAQTVNKYNTHEYGTFNDVTEARSHWAKEIDLNEKIRLIPEIEQAWMKLRVTAEQYPDLKAVQTQINLMERDSTVEDALRDTRFLYNVTAQDYNQLTRIFPRNIVAAVHTFRRLKYIRFPEQRAVYKPKEIYVS